MKANEKHTEKLQEKLTEELPEKLTDPEIALKKVISQIPKEKNSIKDDAEDTGK
jgi:hypothetical protein